jgi:hypothetical protein
VELQKLSQVKALKVRAAAPPHRRADPTQQQRVLQRHLAAHHFNVAGAAALQERVPPRFVGGLVRHGRNRRDRVLDRPRRHQHHGGAHPLASPGVYVESVEAVVDDEVVQ